MGVNTYWLVVAAVIILGAFMPQKGIRKKYYIILMAMLHIFVCGFRYMYLTGDLLKYAATYYELPEWDWFSEYAWSKGRNAGFQWLMKLVSEWTNGDFQIFLILLAVITQVIFAVLIYKYSPKPWLSYLVWNCMAFYITYDFTTIKQGLAMAVLMCAMMCILESKPVPFLIFTLLAGFIHMPALCFLPAYWLMHRKVNERTLFVYMVAAGAIFVFRSRIVDFLSELYYEGNDEIDFVLTSNSPGGRFFVIVLILLAGLVLKGFQEKNFEGLFNIIIVAAIFQMFSGFDNVFTRLADYYLQFTVLYIPMIFYDADQNVPLDRKYTKPILAFNDRSIKILVLLLTVILIWWYYRTCLGVTITNTVDDYTKFRFMWEVMK